jgi:methionine-S-sulfoxide reductase
MLNKATFAGGCFWCTEAVFRQVPGVKSVTPGYTGGAVANPGYEQVCSGRTGHAEAIEIEFDDEVVSYENLLRLFSPPTTRQRRTGKATMSARNTARRCSGTSRNKKPRWRASWTNCGQPCRPARKS